MTATGDDLDALAARFAALFAGRVDVAGRLTVPGRAYQEKTLVTIATYREHLAGRRWPGSSLGIYPLTDEGRCCWGVADVDLGDEASAWRLADALLALGARPLVEVSKSKGHHVWIFFGEWVPAYAARRLLLRAATESGVPCEVFPKQDAITAETPYGNFVHLPYPGHPDAAGGRYFVTRDGRALGPEAFLARVEATELPDWARERPPAHRPPADRLARGAFAGRRAPCVEACLNGTVGEGARNEALVRVAGYLANTEQAPDAEEQTVGAGVRWGLPEREARATFRSAARSGIWYGCDRKREVPEMAAACTYAACPFHRSPTRAVAGARATIGRGAPLPDPAPVPPTGVDPVAEAELIELIAPAGFLRHYVDYCTPLSDAPPVGHLAAALVLVAAALGNRVWMRGFAGNVLRPNVWIVFLAPSGARKSSVMTKAISFLLRLPRGERLLLSNKASIEQWLAELAASPSRLLHADEFMALYQRFERDTMAEARADLTELFATSRKVYSTKKDGPQVINNPALSLLAACTPDELERHVRREHFASGFLARILWLPARQEAPALDRIPPIAPEQERAILDRLGWIATLAGEIAFDEAVDRRLATWAAGFRAAEREGAGEGIGLVNRAFDFAGKFAMLMQVAETEPGTPLWRELDPDVVERAIRLTEWIVRSALRFIRDDLADSEFERQARRLLATLAREGGDTTRRTLTRRMKLPTRDLDALLEYALTGGLLTAWDDALTHPPTRHYRLSANSGASGEQRTSPTSPARHPPQGDVTTASRSGKTGTSPTSPPFSRSMREVAD